MSDFDKEAEREKLREKYGEEEEKRKATEQMSELLLKGATMTNAHCTDCGDPIFRYDGQEFCPTCQKPVAREAGDGASESGDHIEVADPSDDATVQFGADEDGADGAASQSEDTGSEGTEGAAETPDQPGSPAAPADEAATGAARDEPTPTPDQPREIPSADPGRSGADPRPDQHGAESAVGAPSGTAEGDDLAAAESLLAETVHRFARQAAETEDPRRARDHLAAAREAAEALDAVRF